MIVRNMLKHLQWIRLGVIMFLWPYLFQPYSSSDHITIAIHQNIIIISNKTTLLKTSLENPHCGGKMSELKIIH